MAGQEESRRLEAAKRGHREKNGDGDRDRRGRNRKPRDSEVPIYQASSLDAKKATKGDPKRTPSIDPKKPKKPPRKPRPRPSPPPNPNPNPQPPPDPQPSLTSTSYPSYSQREQLATTLQPETCDPSDDYSGSLADLGLQRSDTSEIPQTVCIQVSGKSAEAVVDLSGEESFVSETFAKALKITPKAAGRRRTYQNHSGTELNAKTRIKADIVLNTTLLQNKYLYVLEGKLGHKIVLGKELWTALQPQVAVGAPLTSNGSQYSDDNRQLPQELSSLTIGSTDNPTTPSSHYPQPAQIPYTQAATYGSATEQLTTDSKQIQPAIPAYSTFDPQPSQMHSTYPRSDGYADLQDLNTRSTFPGYAAQEGQGLYTDLTGPYGSDPVAPTFGSAPATTYDSVHVAPAPDRDEYYTLQSDLNRPVFATSYQDPQPASWQTTAPSETVYDQPEQRLSRPDGHYQYATVPKWKSN